MILQIYDKINLLYFLHSEIKTVFFIFRELICYSITLLGMNLIIYPKKIKQLYYMRKNYARRM